MGDVGALALGGALGMSRCSTKNELTLRHHRRHVRARGAQRDHPGRLVQADRQARLPDGADPPPLRARAGPSRRSWCVSGSSRSARARRAGDAQGAMMDSTSSPASNRTSVLVVGSGKTGLAVGAVLRGARRAGHGHRQRGADELGDARDAGSTRRHAGSSAATRRERSSTPTRSCCRPACPRSPSSCAARSRACAITGEMELAVALHRRRRIVGVTGTNGKSTTTTLAGEIARADRAADVRRRQPRRAARRGGRHAGGDAKRDLRRRGCRASSWRPSRRFHPRVAVLLNITPDHLDRYADIERLRRGQGAHLRGAGRATTSRSSTPTTRWRSAQPASGAHAHARVRTSRRARARDGWRLVDGDVDGCELPARGGERYPSTSSRLVGRHNQANALAALLLSRLAGCAPTTRRARGAARLPAAAAPHGAGRRGARRALTTTTRRGPTSARSSRRSTASRARSC